MMMFHDADVDPFGDHFNFDIASSEVLVFDAFPSNLDHTCDDKAQHCNV